MKTPHVSHQRPEDENLGIGANMAYGLQHVLTMYGGIVAVPLIIGQAAGLSPADIGLLIAASLFAGAGHVAANPGSTVFWLSVAAGTGCVVLGCRNHGGDCQQRRRGRVPVDSGGGDCGVPDRFADHASVFSNHQVLSAAGHGDRDHHHRPDADACGGTLGYGRQQSFTGIWQHGQHRPGRCDAGAGAVSEQDR